MARNRGNLRTTLILITLTCVSLGLSFVIPQNSPIFVYFAAWLAQLISIGAALGSLVGRARLRALIGAMAWVLTPVACAIGVYLM
jgi:hypothetical protein